MTARILVALSDEVSLHTCCAEMSACGYAVVSVCTGLLCLNRLAWSHFDLLIVDSELLWGGGLGVVEVMAAEPRFRDLPVILLSAGQHTPESSQNLTACEPGPYAVGLLPPLLLKLFPNWESPQYDRSDPLLAQ